MEPVQNQFPKINLVVISAEKDDAILDICNASPQELFSVLNLMQDGWMIKITKSFSNE